MFRMFVTLLAGFILSSVTLVGQTVTEESILKLLKSNADEALIIRAISMAKSVEVNTSLEGTVALMGKGVPEKIVAALIQRKEQLGSLGVSRPNLEVPPKSLTTMVPEEAGIYAIKDSALEVLPIELTKTKSGGMLKMVATSGIAGGSVLGYVSGPASTKRLKNGVTIVVRCPEGVTPQEYQVIALQSKKDRREFVTGKVGFRSKIGVDDKNLVLLPFEKIGPNTHKTILTNLKPGEYGVLVSGGINPGSTGKMYTFGVE